MGNCPPITTCPPQQTCYLDINPVIDTTNIVQSENYNCWLNSPNGIEGYSFSNKNDCTNRCMGIQDCQGFFYPENGGVPYTTLRNYVHYNITNGDKIDEFEKNSSLPYKYKPFKDSKIKCGYKNITHVRGGNSKIIDILQPGLDYRNAAISLDPSKYPNLSGKVLKDLVIGGSPSDLEKLRNL